MNRREALEKLGYKLASVGEEIYPRLHPAWEGAERAAFDTGFEQGFTACLDLLWSCVENQQKVLEAGNLATQGKWDATSEMKQLAYEGLVALDERIKDEE